MAHMSSGRQPRGRLPRRVYWTRRALVLGVALLLVFGVGKLLGGTGRDAPGAALKASTSSAQQKEQSGSSVAVGPVAPSMRPQLKAKVPLLPPSGDCLADEVSVLPSVPRAWAGTPIVIRLQLEGTQPSCTFAVSPETLVVKIASGNDRIWSSQDCPRSIPKTSVVVRSGQTVEVPVTWSGRRSDEQCTSQPDWALPGFYHVFAAAFGSTPGDVQFEVTRPATRVVTRTPRPRPRPSASTSPRSSTPSRHSTQSTQSTGSKPGGMATPNAEPTRRPTGTPTSRATPTH